VIVAAPADLVITRILPGTFGIRLVETLKRHVGESIEPVGVQDIEHIGRDFQLPRATHPEQVAGFEPQRLDQSVAGSKRRFPNAPSIIR
jgi:hypothetical protein